MPSLTRHSARAPGRSLQLHRKEHLRGRLPAHPPILQEPCFGRPLGRVVQGGVKIAAWMATESWFRPPTAIVSEKGG